MLATVEALACRKGLYYALGHRKLARGATAKPSNKVGLAYLEVDGWLRHMARDDLDGVSVLE